MDILNVIALIVCTVTGVVAGWVWGYWAGYRKAARETHEFMGRLNGEDHEAYCIQCECGAITSNHFHGCPIATELNLVTIAKPDVYIPGLRDLVASRSLHCPECPRVESELVTIAKPRG